MIPVFKPLIEQEEYDAARNALELGWLGMGSFVNKFEQMVLQEIDATDRFAVAVATGTAGLHLALIIAGVGPGDEVIVSAFNCSADYQAIEWVGAKVVFCDCTEDSLELDLSKAQDLISPKTKAIIVMDYDCVMSNHDAIGAFAKLNNLRVIHDAAHSFGSSYNGKKIGSFSDITVFSHDPVKTITCLDGGTIIVKSQSEVEKLHELRLLGMQQPSSVMYQNKRAWTFDVASVGYRYHMLNMHAAIGISQLSKIDVIRKSRQEASRRYSTNFKNQEFIRIPSSDFNEINPFLYYIRVNAEKRDDLRNHLSSHGIDTGIHWIPGHHFSLWKNAKSGNLDNTNSVASEIISLPLHSKMDLETVDKISNAVIDFFE